MLLVVLCVVYIADCFLWQNKHSIVFISWWGQTWKIQTASTIGSASGGLVFLNPFPPLGWFCLNQLMPVSISPEAITSFNSQTIAYGGRPNQKGEIIALSDVQKVSTHQLELWINGRTFCKCGTKNDVENLAQLIEDIRVKKTEDRITQIETFWAQQMNFVSADKEQRAIRTRTSSLRFLCNVQFFYLYLVLPCASYIYGVSNLIIPSAISMLILAIAIAMEYFLAHKEIYPKAKADRVSGAIKMILCPPVSVRAVDLVMHGSHQKHSCLTMTCLLLPVASGEVFVTRFIRDLRFPINVSSMNEATANVCKWQNAAIERLAEIHLPFVAQCIVKLNKLPVQISADRLSFCPRCLSQFSVENVDCPDCPSISLVSFQLQSQSKSDKSP
jgi:hypothetical protein